MTGRSPACSLEKSCVARRVHHKDDRNLAVIVSWALLKCFENPNRQFSWTSHSFTGSDMPPCTEMQRQLG